MKKIIALLLALTCALALVRRLCSKDHFERYRCGYLRGRHRRKGRQRCEG